MLSFPSIVFYCVFLSVPFIFVLAPQYRGNFSHSHLAAGDIYNLPLLRGPDKTAAAGGVYPASGISRSSITTASPKPKIAFLFLTNSNLSFAPLWEKFFEGNRDLFNIYIHSDPSVTVIPPGGVFSNRFIPSKKTYRASPTLISATRRLLAAALVDDTSNQYFALVSQHCIPLHSFRFMYDYLFKSPSSLASLMSWGSSKQSRYKSFIEILSDEPNLLERYEARGLNVMLPEVPFEEFRVGSQFFVLTRRHAALVVKDRRLWSKFKLPCVSEEPCYPEEHYFPTLLSVEDPEWCTGFTLTRVNWTDCWDGHPLEVSPDLVHQLRVSNSSSYSYFFARKFTPECSPGLMDLADDVIFRDGNAPIGIFSRVGDLARLGLAMENNL